MRILSRLWTVPHGRIADAAPLRIDVETARTVSGLQARVALLLATTGLLGTALRDFAAVAGVSWGLAAVAGLYVAAFPRTSAPHVVIAVAGLALLGQDGPFDPVALALVALTHLVLRLSWWSAHLPLDARAEVRAVVPDARRLVLVQTAVQAVGVVLWLVSGGPGIPFVAALGGVAVLALTLVVLPRD
ncbi:hypothetical protein [Cellulosimicrobium arenosum]|uniref:Uncharacterized protein n=1 Tax=Cellulosimicrobium arenosum TaxID=2708133 RepID=A0A927G6K1_9MICO|nr:hypothetical protein [Cellulosimicrobium arenosum]MBD8077803.1 hypothetical protein [Cellulosimicrobium arenosum]